MEENPLGAWFEKHKSKLYGIAIAYLFGTNKELKKQLEIYDQRAKNAEYALLIDKDKRIEAANKMAFKYMERSDTTYVLMPGDDTGVASADSIPRPFRFDLRK